MDLSDGWTRPTWPVSRTRSATPSARRPAELRPVAVGTVAGRASGASAATDGCCARTARPSTRGWPPPRRAACPWPGPNDEDLMAWVFFHDDRPVATLWNYTLHVNTHFGTSFSADYPGRVAAVTAGGVRARLLLAVPAGSLRGHQPHRRLRGGAPAPVGGDARRGAAGPRPATATPSAPSGGRCGSACGIASPSRRRRSAAKWPDCVDVFENEDRLLKADPQDEVATVVQALRIGDGGSPRPRARPSRSSAWTSSSGPPTR